MSKYKNIDHGHHVEITQNEPGFYQLPDDDGKIFCPYPNMFMQTYKDEDTWYIIYHPDYIQSSKEEFKKELELRKTPLWQVIYGS